MSRCRGAWGVHCVVSLSQQRPDKGTPLTIRPALSGAVGQLFACAQRGPWSAVERCVGEHALPLNMVPNCPRLADAYGSSEGSNNRRAGLPRKQQSLERATAAQHRGPLISRNTNGPSAIHV